MKKYFNLTIAVLCASVAIGVAFAETKAGLKYVMYFASGSSKIAPDADEAAQMAAAFIQGNAIKQVVLTGYCDASEKNPAALSHARVKAAADKLRSLGVPNTIPFVLKTSQDLVVPTRPGASEPLNRQVLITF